MANRRYPHSKLILRPWRALALQHQCQKIEQEKIKMMHWTRPKSGNAQIRGNSSSDGASSGFCPEQIRKRTEQQKESQNYAKKLITNKSAPNNQSGSIMEENADGGV